MIRRISAILAILVSLVVQPAMAQVAEEAILVTDAVEIDIFIIRQADVVLVPADKIIRSIGGTIEGEGGAFTLELDGRRVSFSETSRTALAGTELITLPTTPAVVENRPFVPIELFQTFLRPAELSLSWLEEEKRLELGQLLLTPLGVSVELTRIGPISKIVLELEEDEPYRITRRPTSYIVRFARPLLVANETLRFDDPLVSRVRIEDHDVEIYLTRSGVAADSYELQNPPRLIIDLTAAGAAREPLLPDDSRPRPAPQLGRHVGTIVIDPGHGGREVGAEGPGGSLEKDLTLQIARRLERLLSQRNWRVILTRRGDELVPHDERTAIANQNNADLFLSIHLNAVPVGTAEGAETYFLSLNATDDRARLSAERENAGQPARSLESDLDMILWDLAQQAYLKDSSRFAEKLQDAMAEATGVSRRGVKQAPFRVLVGAMMPAALVEVGFISNPEEETRLRTAAYQQSVALALAEAVERYRLESEGPTITRGPDTAGASGLTPQ